jgi:hypothetical protein
MKENTKDEGRRRKVEPLHPIAYTLKLDQGERFKAEGLRQSPYTLHLIAYTLRLIKVEGKRQKV